MTMLLGIDVGTTGAKALLIDAHGVVVASATESYAFDTPEPLWAEQSPAGWWRATIAAIRRVLDGRDTSAVAGVGLTGQMHGLVLLDARGDALRPCIMWNDQRSGPQCEAITRQIGAQRLLDLIANPVLPGFTAPKIVWVREHEPDVYARIAHVLLPKDYVRYRLTGALATDVADASGTALFDVRRRDWSAEMLAALDIPRGWLPDAFESPAVCARISAAAAAESGLMAGTPVVGGAGDQAAQAIGSGIVRAGVVSVTLGTSGVVFAATEQFAVAPEGRLHAFCHAVPGRWHLMGVMLSAAGSFRWFRDTLGAGERAQAAATGADAYDLLTALAAQAPAGSEGLFFLPYLSGERTPYADPDARGAYIGLTLRHGKAHLIRALLEGVTFGLRDALELLLASGLPVREVRASGGGARSTLWRQLLADVFDAPITTVNTTEGAAYGAALLAGVGAGVYADVDAACAATVRTTATVEPGPAVPVYAAAYPVYRSLYPALAGTFKTIGRLA
ncbi:MAG: xylulokinase [Chloroflexi bacterium]|nr:xylulokinase [Chloroflexota bacterium]